ncbi:nitrate transporter 1.7, NRT1/ PTR family 2.13 [Hibiscus trionum]|uniref:Nitrate transporter 1.7, NRT1/ PTR family 2.13 n=1 Tax=Hibiscus trionum TaxID=183268 RepID=A0A9W7IYP3_HIBTR|nr:nitrate transporter 1.7, NRT1/ PTR family 2.13 [Hibiscus trionum]
MGMKSVQDQKTDSFFLYLCSKWFRNSPSPSREQGATTRTEGNALSVSVSDRKIPGGWRAMPLILGNETFERFASTGLMSNFMVYLMKEYNLTQVSASNVLFIWFGVTNFAPLVGAFISDAYFGKFLTILAASFASFLGMLIITLTAWFPGLQPPKCQPRQQLHGHCIGPSMAQMGVLLTGLGLITIGTGGIRPCSIPFGVDQFDPTTEEGAKGINSFFNWYYTTFTVVIMLTLTLVVYIQDQVSWVLGFAIPTILMACSIVLFLFGTRIFVRVKPQGSIFSSIVQVFVAAYKKRHLKVPAEGQECGVYYDPPLKGNVLSKLPLTDQFRFLNKAVIMTENDIELDGSCNRWRLSSVQDVEEVKCIIRIIPVWSTGIIGFTAMGYMWTFTVPQALIMDRRLGPKFIIPAGSMMVIQMIVIGIFVPVYDRIIAPALQKITKREGGITLLQRIGIGNFFTILTLIACGVFERIRRNWATLHPGAPPISVFWLSPQLALMGLVESFNILGQIEFYNRQFPDHMRSIANSLIFCSLSGSSYLCSMVVNIIHHVTGGHGHPDWLTNDLNAGKLDYFYYVGAVVAAFNFVYFIYVARRYRYKGEVETNSKSEPNVELSPMEPTNHLG